jgi:YVTN family beta-propeller protein
MYNNNSNHGRVAFARGFMALFAIMLVMGLGLMARPAAAAPFAYVTNHGSDTVSVIDTATNMVVATVTDAGKPFANVPFGVAVTLDGKHAYVTNNGSSSVSVIDTAMNMVVATVALPAGSEPRGVAITPDGKHAYVVNHGSNTVSVIDTGMNTVAATVAVGPQPYGVTITPDGKHAYVANFGNFSVPGTTVSVIDTTTNPPSVVATVAVGAMPVGVASRRTGYTPTYRISAPTTSR